MIGGVISQHDDASRFPWVQTGSIGATVSRVATEVRDGAIRVNSPGSP
jgi:hypothetical protein